MSIKSELEYIRNNNNGLLKPNDVIDFAKNEKTELHDHFEWNNKKAGYEHRLWQARQLIVRVTVEIPEKEEETIQVQAYFSLKEDREKGGGYRYTVDVMSDKERRKQLLDQALQEFEYFQNKYKMLDELSDLFKKGKEIQYSLAGNVGNS